MSYSIAIASGKGGTGKTTVAVNLLQSFLDAGVDAVLADCDVEEPNDSLFLSSEISETEEVVQHLAEVHPEKCTFCGRCAEACAFNAILNVPSVGYIKIMPDLCHACGVCSYVCPESGAITEYAKARGYVRKYQQEGKQILIEGALNLGEAMAVPVIKAAKKALNATAADIQIIDAPPGTSCPAMETIQDADYVLLVAEPTPYGLNDLKIMLQTVWEMNLRVGVIINRYGIGEGALESYLNEEKVDILAKIPFQKHIASVYSNGDLLVQAIPEMKMLFNKLQNNLMLKQKPYAANHHY